MRQFILAAKAAYPANVSALTKNQIGIVYDNDGTPTMVTTGAEAKRMQLVQYLGPEMQSRVIPLFKHHFSYSKMIYRAGTTFSASIVISEELYNGDYTIMVVKKGVNFNERNKWTSTVSHGLNDTLETLAAKLVKAINNNSVGSGVKAEYNDTTRTLTITALKPGVDYAVVTADNFYGTEVSITSIGKKAIGDAAMVTDMFNKAAADMGFEYTGLADDLGLYPGYFNYNPLAANPTADTGFIVYTLRFAEPREMKTVDEVVHQIVQIALPTGTAAITTLDTIFAKLAE